MRWSFCYWSFAFPYDRASGNQKPLERYTQMLDFAILKSCKKGVIAARGAAMYVSRKIAG